MPPKRARSRSRTYSKNNENDERLSGHQEKNEKNNVVYPSFLSGLAIIIEELARSFIFYLPRYIIKSQEISRMCSIMFTYLIFQLLGFCYAVTVNASLSFACSSFVSGSALNMSQFNSPDAFNNIFAPSTFSIIVYILQFYVYWSSISIVFRFTRTIFKIGLESIKDFAEIKHEINELKSNRLYNFVFTVLIICELMFLTGDYICQNRSDYYALEYSCSSFGFFFLSSSGTCRRVTLICLFITLIQLWQTCIVQYDFTFHRALNVVNISFIKRSSYEFFVLLLFLISSFGSYIIIYINRFPEVDDWKLLFGNYIYDLFGNYMHSVSVTNLTMNILCFIMLLFTLWLFIFRPILQNAQEIVASQNNQKPSIIVQNYMAFIRLSYFLILFVLFIVTSIFSGPVQAQSDLTLAAIAIPAIYCLFYIISDNIIDSGPFLFPVLVPLSFVLAYFITSKVGSSTGKGSVLLVFCHLLGYIAYWFSEHINDSVEYAVEDDLEEYLFVTNNSVHENKIVKTARKNRVIKVNNFIDDSDINNKVTSIALKKGNLHQMSISRQESIQFLMRNIPASAMNKIKGHWFGRQSKRNIDFITKLLRPILPKSFFDMVLRGFIGFALFMAFFLLSLCILSAVQQSSDYYPSFFSFQDNQDSSIKFNHVISNATIYPKDYFKDSTHCGIDGDYYQDAFIDSIDMSINCYSKDNYNSDNNSSSSKGGDTGKYKGKDHLKFNINYKNRTKYSICDLQWQKGINIIDFALLSEIAYLDHRNIQYLQNAIDTVMPKSKYDFKVMEIDINNKGPAYFQARSEKYNVTILSLRGTDIGRISDVMEDIKLYAEPVVFTMLSAIFPTFRLWSDDTTSSVIEWLYEFNSFFGLQGEAEYYRPLTDKIYSLQANGENIIVTGHSLGGGLARLVGALTNIQSVTFAPPGIRMSYRKYSTTAPDGSQVKIVSNDLHGQSVAVVTEYDWVSLVDEQVALVQKISCDKPESGMFMACHLIEGTICHLINNCGDDRFDGCDYDFDVTEGYNQAKIHLSNYINSNKEVARMYRLLSFSGYFFLVYILVTIFVSIMYLF